SRKQSSGAKKLRCPGHRRSRARPDRNRDKGNPRRARQPQRRIRQTRGRRAVASQHAHSAVLRRLPQQPRANAPPQAAAAQGRDNPPVAAGFGKRADTGADASLHQASPSKGGTWSGKRTQALRQAARHDRARTRTGGNAGSAPIKAPYPTSPRVGRWH
ncbi:hypothetical protein GBAR_LOCUS874, partial [Geodia barretti]